MLALERSGRLLASGDADTEADLVGRSVVHPLLVKNVLTRDVGGDIATDGVAHVGGTVRIELSPLVAGHEADAGEITDGHQLHVEWRLDKVSTGNGTVGDDACVVTRLGAVGDCDLLDIGKRLTSSGRSKSAPVVDGIDGSKTRDRGLVDGRVELRCRGIGGSVPVG